MVAMCLVKLAWADKTKKMTFFLKNNLQQSNVWDDRKTMYGACVTG